MLSFSLFLYFFFFFFYFFFFFFNDTATTEIYTLSLHDALPICRGAGGRGDHRRRAGAGDAGSPARRGTDRKSTRLNSSHMSISYAVFCLKKKIWRPAASSTRSRFASRWGAGRCCVFLLLIRRPRRSTLFPYTTLFRSARRGQHRRPPEAVLPLRAVGEQLQAGALQLDRKSTRLNSSHMSISYAVFCLKKKKKKRSKFFIKKKKKIEER